MTWTLSGLQARIPQSQITTIGSNKYVKYHDFQTIAKTIDQPLHCLIKRDHIISNIDMKKICKQAELTPQQKNKMQQLKMRREMRQLDKYKTNYNYFETSKDETVKDMSKSLSFGMSFIFSFFMAGLTGYYFGVYFLGLEFVYAMMVSVVFIMATIIIETTLFIIKQDRDDKIKARKDKDTERHKKKKYQFQGFKQNPGSSGSIFGHRIAQQVGKAKEKTD